MLVLTAFSDRARILGALEAGACGYLLKDAASEDVAEGIRAAARGESPLDPRAARTVLSARTEPDPLAGLSQREREVLDALVEGLPNKLIARRLEISEKTVKSHLTRDLPRARRDRPHAGRAVGRAPRSRPKVSLSPGPGRWHRPGCMLAPPSARCSSCCSRAAARRAARPPSASRSTSAPRRAARSRPRSRVDRARGLARRRRPRGPRRLARHAVTARSPTPTA